MTEFRGLACSLLYFFFISAAYSQQHANDTSWLYPQSQTNTHIRERRDTYTPGKPQIATGKAQQACLAPGGKPGHCKHMSACGEKLFGNFFQSASYICIIDKQFVGICCPDDASNNDQNNRPRGKGWSGSLPSIATEGDDVEASPDNTSAGHSRVNRGCGYSTHELNSITGGKAHNSTTYPWIAAILGGPEKVHFCGGALITDRHVLSAAHCFFEITSPKVLTVRLGEYNLDNPYETRALDFNVAKIRMHPAYSDITKANDIAILKLERPTIFNTYIWPLCLSPLGATFENKDVTIIGWGAEKYKGNPSRILKAITVPVWPQNVCVTKFVQEITPKHICAAAYEGNGDACQGDSGGPLMHRLSNGRWITVGIVSWGIGCGNPNKPGIYTRVNAYLDWIFANAVF